MSHLEPPRAAPFERFAAISRNPSVRRRFAAPPFAPRAHRALAPSFPRPSTSRRAGVPENGTPAARVVVSVDPHRRGTDT
ncbi:hypothetical protein [Burkholderia pseudomallei]|uniref:hypothetical protein n=1 Tax=Burkholderia pseudomallei TaxID=28450 RepID=UPI00059E333D|nr:hypothetical protein [Burkholderia pseudomallei]